jgi:hypothetical protein
MARQKLRMKLWLNDPLCFVCKKNIDDFSETSLEHIIPIAHGGKNSKDNLAVSHPVCNQLKADLLSPELWEKKIQEHFNSIEQKLWRQPRSDYFVRVLIQKSFINSEFIQSTLEKFPTYFTQTQIPKIDLRFQIQHIQKLSTNRDINQLIEASKVIHTFGTKPYWKIIFALLFLEFYNQSKDITAILHAIWRLGPYPAVGRNLILYSYSRYLWDLCQKLEPTAFEKWNQRKIK